MKERERSQTRASAGSMIYSAIAGERGHQTDSRMLLCLRHTKAVESCFSGLALPLGASMAPATERLPCRALPCRYRSHRKPPSQQSWGVCDGRQISRWRGCISATRCRRVQVWSPTVLVLTRRRASLRFASWANTFSSFVVHTSDIHTICYKQCSNAYTDLTSPHRCLP